VASLKKTELNLIFELMKNSHRSDRDLSKIIGVSQPTVSRMRSRLEKNGTIKEYTMIPDFTKLGLTLLAITLVKYKVELGREERRKVVAKMKALADDASSPEAFLVDLGIGMGYDAVALSFLKDYSDYTLLIKRLKQHEHIQPAELQSFIVNLKDEVHLRSLTLSTLPKYLLDTQKKDNEV